MSVEIEKTKENFLPENEISLKNETGLKNPTAFIVLLIWYLSSISTIFSNKFILSNYNGNFLSLSLNQLLVSVFAAHAQNKFDEVFRKKTKTIRRSMRKVFRENFLVGLFRCTNIVFGFLALKFVPVSFVATIRASAPVFTVIISRLLLDEKIGSWTKLSMIPITFGLALCSSFELSFHIVGFLSGLLANLADCLQHVYSKILVSNEKESYTSGEVQFWASLVGTMFQLPIFLLNVPIVEAFQTSSTKLILLYIFNGFSYHFQSITAVILLGYISPITFSVANTVKRAFIIWLSILVFRNPVTFLSTFGTCLVLFGVFCYNEARNKENI